MAQFLNDSFTDTNGVAATAHTGETGATWVGQTGSAVTPTVQSNAFDSGTGSGDSWMYSSGVPAAADYSVTADIIYRGANGSPGTVAGPGARLVAGANTGYFGIILTPTNGFGLYKILAGTKSQLAVSTGVAASFVNGETFRLTTRVSGTTVGLTIQRLSDSTYLQPNETWAAAQVERFTVTDSSITAAGRAGFWLSRSPTAGQSSLLTAMTATDAVVVASALTLTGPNTGAVGSAATFTIAADAPVSVDTVVNLSDSGGGGTWAPTSVTILSGATAASSTATYTPASAGAKTLTTSNNGALSNPSVTYTATASLVIPVDDANLKWSPFNWDTLDVGTFGVTTKTKQTACCGAYVKFRVTGTTSIALAIDTSTYSGLSTTPLVRWTINGGPSQTSSPANGATSLALASSLTVGNTYEVCVWLYGAVEATGTRWNASSTISPTNVLRIKGITLITGASVSPPAIVGSQTAVFFGDSIDEGVRASGGTTQPADHARSYGWFVGPALNCEYGITGFGLQGWSQAGNGGIPAFTTAWKFHTTGRPKDFSTPPTYAFVRHGTNGTPVAANITNWLTDARGVFGASTWIFVVIPQGQQAVAAITAGVAAYKVANPNDSRVVQIDVSSKVSPVGLTGAGSASEKSVDGTHPYEWHNGLFASAVTDSARVALAGTASPGQVVGIAAGVGITATGQLVPII